MPDSGWFGLFAPAGTPAPVLQRLNTEITALLRDPGIVERFKTMGMEPIPSSPEQLASLLRTEIAAYKAVIQRAGIKAE